MICTHTLDQQKFNCTGYAVYTKVRLMYLKGEVTHNHINYSWDFIFHHNFVVICSIRLILISKDSLFKGLSDDMLYVFEQA